MGHSVDEKRYLTKVLQKMDTEILTGYCSEDSVCMPTPPLFPCACEGGMLVRGETKK